ncbi:MAG: hypothetical protein ACTSRZ_20700 [Promethearchaeota archaeon]
MFEDDFSDIKKRFALSAKEGKFLTILIDFYIRITDILRNYRDKITIIEIKPKIVNLEDDKYSFDYINFIVIIRSDEYLMFLINDKPESLTMEDLEIFNEIFRKQSKKKGIFIVYNDEQLNCTLLLSDELYSIKKNLPKVFQSIKKKYSPLNNIIDELIDEPDYELKKLDLKKYRRDDIIEIFHKNLNFYLKNELERIRGEEKREFLSEFDSTKVSKILNILEDFFEEVIEDKDLEHNYKDLIKNFLKL